MTIQHLASAKHKDLGKDGTGYDSTGSGALKDQAFGFNIRLENDNTTNSEEQIAAAHAGCFTRALSFGLPDKG